jgi:peptidoglycan hydrolase CwlO-like protein
MAYIQRANVILEVDDSQVGYYTNLGYNLIDAKGNIIQKAKSNDVHTLQQELSDSQAEVEKLKAEIVELKKTIEDLKNTSVDEPVKTTRRKKGAE